MHTLRRIVHVGPGRLQGDSWPVEFRLDTGTFRHLHGQILRRRFVQYGGGGVVVHTASKIAANRIVVRLTVRLSTCVERATIRGTPACTYLCR
jgi:hypothetical protein